MNTITQGFPQTRLRRLRQSSNIRNLVRETTLNINDMVLPLFINENLTENKSIESMPGHNQLALQQLDREIDEIVELNISAIILFGIPKHKDACGSESYNDNGIVQQAIRHIKERAPNLMVIADSCLCQYTDHGHCGLIEKNNSQYHINNDETLPILVRQAISYAKAGADIIAPSGMMDGMISAMRHGLDDSGYSQISLMSYSAKYSSALYGPFRQAAEGAPQFGDRSSYQMDPANGQEALREIELDINEGADIIIVKPALNYLDIIYRGKQQFPTLPFAAYQVGGEFAMIKAAAERKWIDEERAMLESLIAIKRAGASIIINYFAKDVAKLL